MSTSSTVRIRRELDSPVATTSVLAFAGEDVWGLLVVPPAATRDDVRCVVHTAEGALDYGDGFAAEQERLEATWSDHSITASANGLVLEIELDARQLGADDADTDFAVDWLEATGTIKVGGAHHHVRGRALRIDVANLPDGSGACVVETIAVAGTVGQHDISVAKTAGQGGGRATRTGGVRRRDGHVTEAVKDLELRLDGSDLRSLTLDFGGCPVGFHGTPPQDLDAVGQSARVEVSAQHARRPVAVTAWFVRLRDFETDAGGHGIVLWARPVES